MMADKTDIPASTEVVHMPAEEVAEMRSDLQLLWCRYAARQQLPL